MKEANVKYSVGCDISMDSFHACISVINHEQAVKVIATTSFRNNKKGFEEFKNWMTKHRKEALSLFIVMEATGVYYEQLAWYLHQLNYQVSVLLPNKAKRYMQSLGIKTKNDKIDAKGLSRMGAEQKLPLWQPASPVLFQLRQLTRHYESIQTQITVYKNQLHALEHAREPNELVVENLEEITSKCSKLLVLTRKAIEETVLNDAALSKKYKQIRHIKGLGLLSWATIVAETNGFTLYKNVRQLSSAAGYDVKERQSGKYAGKRCISKQGNSRMRRILHMPSLCVVRYGEPVFVSLYERVWEKTGIKMKGYVAVQRKLLCLIFSLWKNDAVYDKNYLSTSQIVERKQESVKEEAINRISENEESKLLFPFRFTEAALKE